MPRKGKTTLGGTSGPELVSRLIDRYIQEKKKKGYMMVRLSRSKVIEISVLDYLDRIGVLEQFLQEFGKEDAEIESIKAHLQAERQTVLKQQRSKE